MSITVSLKNMNFYICYRIDWTLQPFFNQDGFKSKTIHFETSRVYKVDYLNLSVKDISLIWLKFRTKRKYALAIDNYSKKPLKKPWMKLTKIFVFKSAQSHGNLRLCFIIVPCMQLPCRFRSWANQHRNWNCESCKEFSKILTKVYDPLIPSYSKELFPYHTNNFNSDLMSFYIKHTIFLQGGKEHGVPILISEIHEGQPADRCKGLFIGDAILAVNGIDLRNAKHSEAVQILSQQVKSCNVCFQHWVNSSLAWDWH